MPNSEVKRAVRVAEQVRERLADALRDMRDPRLARVLLTRVEMTDDLRLARVHVRDAFGDTTEARQMIKGLESASARLRRSVTGALKLRYSPELRFYFDDGQDAAVRVEAILKEIAEERKD